MRYLLLILLTLAACEKPLGIEDNVRKTVVRGNIIPLQVGNEWVYRVNEYDENNGIINGPVHQTISISDTKDFSGHTWFKFFDSEIHLELYYRSQDDGIWMKLPDHFPGQDIRLLKLPSEINDPDTITFFNIPRDDSKLLVQTLIDTDMKIDVNGEQLEVIKFKFELIDKTTQKFIGPYLEQYYSSGLGLVKENYFSEDQNGHFFISKTREMVSATIQ